MALTYKNFTKMNIDLAPLGWEKRSEYTLYFCTPRGAKVLGWAGVDGIHYCTIRGFGDMVFAVNPMDIGDYVHPIARSFEDVLRLLLSCVDMAVLEQCYAWDEDGEQYKAFLIDCPATAEQQAVLDLIREKTGLAPMEDAFAYVKQLQAGFDLSSIPYTEDYYDVDMNPTAPQEPPKWEVYFDGNFWGHAPRQKPGTEIPLGTQFDWADHHWVIPAAYACSKGLVVDYCMRIEPWLIEAFMDKWDLTVENEGNKQFTQEERMRMELDNPMHLDFYGILHLNGKEVRPGHSCGCMWNPCLPSQYVADCEGKWVAQHYGLDMNFGWMFWRSSYPWPTKRKPEVKSLSVTMEQEMMRIPGPHFQVEKPGDTFCFPYLEKGTEYTLTVQEYEKQVLKMGGMPDYLEYPTHHHVMSYTVTPPLPEGVLTIQDCDEGDRPRSKKIASRDGSPAAMHDACAIGIIGGADGPTAIICGNAAAKLHAACSSLHFETVEKVQWRMVFHEKKYEDLIEILLQI